MTRIAPQDRLQPSLLDRLTDENPSQKKEQRESRVLTKHDLREYVLRDLSWLLNTGNLGPIEDLDDYPLVAESTLNYGIPHLAGSTASQIDPREMERRLKQAIWKYEPRILRDSIQVRIIADDLSMSHNAVSFQIEGMLWAEPTPWHVYLKTEADLEMGTFSLTEVTGREDS